MSLFPLLLRFQYLQERQQRFDHYLLWNNRHRQELYSHLQQVALQVKMQLQKYDLLIGPIIQDLKE